MKTALKFSYALLGLYLLPFTVSIFSLPANTAELSTIALAELIRDKYDHEFIKLRGSAQRHYSARMYRLTSENQYVTGVIDEVFQLHDKVTYFSQRLSEKSYRIAQANKLIKSLPNTRRGKLRKSVLKNTGDKRFALYLMYQLAKLNEYGLTHPKQQEIINYLKQAQLKTLILSPKFIKAYAAQVANYVYWSYQLEIGDWRKDLIMAFKSTYPDHEDKKLSKSQFQNKIYGLTHIVIAASEYYQKNVKQTEFAWIIDYFSNNIDRILDKTKSDVHAEVGICFLLAQQDKHQALTRLKTAVAKQIDLEKQMILSVKGNDNLSRGEHRNILAYALLAWPEKLTQGPLLLGNEKWLNSLPMDYQQ